MDKGSGVEAAAPNRLRRARRIVLPAVLTSAASRSRMPPRQGWREGERRGR